MVRDATYIRCNSKYIGDKEEGAQPDPLTFTYMGGAPSDGFVESKFFPYQGKSAQPDYQSPMVAVKVGGLTVWIYTVLFTTANTNITCYSN